jgi:LSD1 subclass zinc finger protein
MSVPESTSLESLLCNSCGAPLSVPPGANFVTCNHCQTQLAVRRTSTVSYTEALQQVAQKTDQLTEQVRYLAWQNELNALDREWEREKQSHMIRGKNGSLHEPSEFLTFFGAAVFGIVAVVALAVAAGSGSGAPLFFALFAIVGGIVTTVINYNKSRDYRAAHRRYMVRRQALSPQTIDLGAIAPPSVSGRPSATPATDAGLFDLGPRDGN